MTQDQQAPQCSIEDLCINTIRTLSMDAIQEANSGHPGAPMGLAPAGFILWSRILKHNPANPAWPNRDRFVLSGGHASMLLYSLLHLTGYDLTLDDIKQFRQWGSRTPGHPEYGHTPGVETTTGPLGQGVANAVGMAMAEQHLASRFNRPGFDIVDHHTYVMCGDGDMMEGVSGEAASLAGHLGLGRLVCIYDDNQISIEGGTQITFTEDVAIRFQAYQWQVLRVSDGNDIDAIQNALKEAREESGRPSLIILRTHIAYGSPNKQDSADAHGAPLGPEEVCLTKKNLGCPEDEIFCIPDVLGDVRSACLAAGKAAEKKWNALFAEYAAAYPELARQWERALRNIPEEGWESDLPDFSDKGPLATRAASGKVLNAIAPKYPGLIGGSADLAPSNKTVIDTSFDFQKGAYDGRNIRFGVREHAMGAIMNGMALHGGVRPYGGTFLVFADYMRPSIRLASLMKLPVIYVFTHDSVAVGEDGPTHQPVEHLASLRAIPGLKVIRPADASETADAWLEAIQTLNGPVALILSRQKLPVFSGAMRNSDSGLASGAYVLSDSETTPDIILLSTGAEVHIALDAAEQLREEGRKVRVVNMPSWKLFEETSDDYKISVLPPEVTARVAVEAGLPMGWERYVGSRGAVVGISRFGASAPGALVLEKLGISADNVVKTVRSLL
ncbi:Transketolase (EC [Olavius algarvensis associated proteobacterium Delta 3]|nr:Transketolase (EC [Olavius algarvensis associated proteobacterium Delta 3]